VTPNTGTDQDNADYAFFDGRGGSNPFGMAGSRTGQVRQGKSVGVSLNLQGDGGSASNHPGVRSGSQRRGNELSCGPP
jgi:hypothetical protein